MKTSRLRCPYCESELVIPDDHAGEKVQCPDCGGFFMLPDADRPRIPAGLQLVRCPSCDAEQTIPLTADEVYYRKCSNCGKPFLFAPHLAFRCAEKLPSKKWGELRIGCPFCHNHYSLSYLPDEQLMVCRDCFKVFAYPDSRPELLPDDPAEPSFRNDVPAAVTLPADVVPDYAPAAVPRSAAPLPEPVAPATVQVAYVSVSRDEPRRAAPIPPPPPPVSAAPAAKTPASGPSAIAAVGKASGSTAATILRICGNLLWLLLGGLLGAVLLFLQGAFFCLTIIGIPFGLQLFKLALLVLSPFGADVYRKPQGDKVGCLSTGFNILWILSGGIWMALGSFLAGLFYCATLIGIPFGLQYFKLGKLELAPFGLEIRYAPGMKIVYAIAGGLLLIAVVVIALV